MGTKLLILSTYSGSFYILDDWSFKIMEMDHVTEKLHVEEGKLIIIKCRNVLASYES